MESCGSTHLIDDLIPFILDHLTADSQSCLAQIVAPLALVSPVWLTPVRRILYSSPKLLSYHACYLLSRTLTDNPTLGDRIRALHLHPVSRLCKAGDNCSCKSVNAIALSLAPLFQLANLAAISLGCDYALHAEWYLHNFAFPESVRELCVEGAQWYWSFEINRPISASLRWNESLASRFMNLKRLKLVNLDLRICEPRAFKSRSPHIESLHLDRVQITIGKLSDLARNTWGDLQELELIVPEYRREYDVYTILSEAADSLHALTYFIKDGQLQNDLRAATGKDTLASCSALRDLQLSMPFTLSTLSNLGQQLAHLEVLKVYGNYEVSAEDWAATIAAGAFPCLRELYLPIGHELRHLAEWQWPGHSTGSILRACAARMISLHFGYLLA